MVRSFEAIYSNGVLRPVEPVDFLDENRRVTVLVEMPDESRRPLAGWVGGLTNGDAEDMRRSIEADFEQVDPDDWK
jgi:predicted DNA-binding antitoxin AbrB/MazE fold protein